MMEHPSDWVKYIAIDANGIVYGHENEPCLGVDEWVSSGRKEQITSLEGNGDNWKQSLLKKRLMNQRTRKSTPDSAPEIPNGQSDKGFNQILLVALVIFIILLYFALK